MGSSRLKYVKAQMTVPWSEDKQSIVRPSVHLTEDHVIIEDTIHPDGSGICLKACSV